MLPEHLGHAVRAGVSVYEGAKIIQVVDAGSRAWGLDSPDSDWDLRAVIVYHPDRYLGLVPPDDCHVRKLTGGFIKTFMVDGPWPDDTEVVLWDVHKFLKLVGKCNGSALEWLFSDLYYCWPDSELGQWWGQVRGWVRSNFNPFAFCHDRLGVASGALKKRWPKLDQPGVKDALCVIRPLWQIEWVLAGGTVGPMNLQEMLGSGGLREVCDTSLTLGWIETATGLLIQAKQQQAEWPMAVGPVTLQIDVVKWMEDLKARIATLQSVHGDMDALNELCLQAVRGDFGV